MSAPEEIVYMYEPPNSNANTKDDLSETSSDCPNKRGEGGNGPFYCPLFKVVVRSEEVPPELNLDHKKTRNVEQPIILNGVEDKRKPLPLQEDPGLENYHNINSLGFSARARAHLLRNLAKESDNWNSDEDYSEGRYELASHCKFVEHFRHVKEVKDVLVFLEVGICNSIMMSSTEDSAVLHSWQ